jgi:hypothetical protein
MYILAMRGAAKFFTFTKTLPPVPSGGLPAKPFEMIVVVVFKTGLKNDTCGKYGDERRIWFVAGSGYIPRRYQAT